MKGLIVEYLPGVGVAIPIAAFPEGVTPLGVLPPGVIPLGVMLPGVIPPGVMDPGVWLLGVSSQRERLLLALGVGVS